MSRKTSTLKEPQSLPKSPTGILGLDEITGGGLPSGRPTLVCGGAGCGKTMLATEFLVRGAAEFGEPGVFMMFEESAAELTANVRSMGFDLDRMVKKKQLILDYVHVERSEFEETGEFDLEGLFIRLDYAIRTVGAKRVVLDTLEVLFSGFTDHTILRAELRRLFRWLKDRGMTTVITGENGDDALTRFGFEEFLADCVIMLDHRVSTQISTRRLRIVKYRGSAHGTNEYPFLIGDHGISVLPITSLKLEHQASTKRVSTGIAGLDEMLGGKGIYRGSSVLVSGSSGTGKSTIGAAVADAACRRGDRCLMFCYEESASQLIRNMRSVGVDLGVWVEKGLLQIHASRPTLHGVERHLLNIFDTVRAFKPSMVFVDPISNLSIERDGQEVKPTLMRLIDFLKQQQITAVFTNLTSGAGALSEDSQLGVSSLMDVWFLLRNVEYSGERNRTLYVLKARGVQHSNQVREFQLSNAGIELVDVYVGDDGVLTGTARAAQEARHKLAADLQRQEAERRTRQQTAKLKAIQAEIEALKAEAEAEAAESELAAVQNAWVTRTSDSNKEAIARLRRGEAAEPQSKLMP